MRDGSRASALHSLHLCFSAGVPVWALSGFLRKRLAPSFLARPEHRNHRTLSGHSLVREFFWREKC
ncbi:hypothetical protein GCT19_22025 [Paraburkholderia sp. CNPSo 3155]|nr:hypothetical protein [Paraburkholderia atlantica]NUY35630.1 hypothetical protein [Paraburkholderia atlantica]